MTDQLVAEIIESAPFPKSELTTIIQALDWAAQYLAAKEISANRPDSPEDLRMRLAGAGVQQRVTQFILNNYIPTGDVRETQSRNWIQSRLDVFWNGYRRLVLRPLERRGYNIQNLPPETGMRMVFEVKQGVKGMVATALLARANGWTVEFPTVEEDVKQGKDLIVINNYLKVPVQIKCALGAVLGATRYPDTPELIHVYIPGNPEFFMDENLGIPHRKHADTFRERFERQLKS